MIGETGDIVAEDWGKLASVRSQPGTKLGKTEILFVKYEDDLIQAQIDKLFAGSGRKPAAEVKVEDKPTVTIDEFKKFDIRVAEVLEATPLEKSKKLIKLRVRVGDVEKQILAGIKEFYEADALPGRKIVIITNSNQRTLMGEKSEGMLLAASN
jgi:methionyl-tRNA synthetase